MIGEHLDLYTYEKLLKDCLDRVPNTIDKREGSIIHDAIAPACVELAQAYIALKGILIETYVLTANGEYLDLRAAEQGLTRYSATRAVKRASFKDSDGKGKDIPIGSRFSTIESSQSLNYIVTDYYRDGDGQQVSGSYILACETPGSAGNHYIGNLLPLSFIDDLAEAVMEDLLIPGGDEETDEELRSRYKESIDAKSFGGNVSQYVTEVKGMEGVGAVQVYPVWQGGGTVKVSILGADFKPASESLIRAVQEELDPELASEDGETNAGSEARYSMLPSSQASTKGRGIGLAPIGHKVTVSTAQGVAMDVAANIVISEDRNPETIKVQVKDAIDDYLTGIRKEWDHKDHLNRYQQSVYISQINFAILSVSGVKNVTAISLNGGNVDVELKQEPEIQEIPVLGEVVVNVG